MSRKSEFSCWSLLCVVVLLAAAMSSAQTAPSQDADANAAPPATESGAATIAPSRPRMAYLKAQRLKNNPAPRSQFLPQLKQRSASSVRHNKKFAPAPSVDALLDATNLTWAGTGAPNNPVGQAEQGYTLLPDGNVLTVDTYANVDQVQGPATAEQHDPRQAHGPGPAIPGRCFAILAPASLKADSILTRASSSITLRSFRIHFQVVNR